MNILVLAPQPFFQHRGTPIAVKLLVECLAKQHHDVGLLTYHEGENVDTNGSTLYRIPHIPAVRGIRPGFSGKKLICDAVFFFKSLSLLRRKRYDLIHAVEESAFIALFIKKVFGIPYLYDMDSSLAQQMMERYGWLRLVRGLLEGCEKTAVRESAGVVAACKRLEELVETYEPGKSVLRLEDTSLLNSEGSRRDRPGRALQIPRPIAMYVGNLERYQGIDLLLESFKVLHDKGCAGSLAVIGGRETDIARYRENATALGINERVFFLGPKPIEELGTYLAQADVLVSPRIKGYNTPMKVYSYLDSGKPLLATRLPTHTQLLDDDTAYLVAPEPEEMAEGLIRLFRDKELASRLAVNAKRLARREFSVEAYERKLRAFYRAVEQRVIAQAS